jgi:lysophospholipase L1-like esterase
MKRLLATLLLSLPLFAQGAFTFQPGDRVVFVGNTFAERLGQHGYFEAIVAARLPELKLTFRNLGWSADTVAGPNVRPLNFGDQSQHLSEQKPDIIFACYGMSESFGGDEGLEKFRGDLTSWVQQTKSANFSGKSTPRLVLVSPIAHERLGGKLPDPTAHNAQLARYTETMGAVAKANGSEFLDLFTPTQKLMADSEASGATRLTFNGIHLTDYGYWAVAQIMADSLGLHGEPWKLQMDFQAGTGGAPGSTVASQRVTPKSLPVPAPPQGVTIHKELRGNLPTVVANGLQAGKYELRSGDAKVAVGTAAEWAAGVVITTGPAQDQVAKLLAVVDDKNQQFFYRWRAVNGEYIYGRRKEPFGIVNFPAEMKQLDEMVAERDAKISQLAQPPGTQAFELVRLPE